MPSARQVGFGSSVATGRSSRNAAEQGNTHRVTSRSYPIQQHGVARHRVAMAADPKSQRGFKQSTRGTAARTQARPKAAPWHRVPRSTSAINRYRELVPKSSSHRQKAGQLQGASGRRATSVPPELRRSSRPAQQFHGQAHSMYAPRHTPNNSTRDGRFKHIDPHGSTQEQAASPRQELSASLSSVAQRLQKWSESNSALWEVRGNHPANSIQGEHLQPDASGAIMGEVARAVLHLSASGAGKQTTQRADKPAAYPINSHQQPALSSVGLSTLLPSVVVGAPVIDAAVQRLEADLTAEVAALSNILSNKPHPAGVSSYLQAHHAQGLALDRSVQAAAALPPPPAVYAPPSAHSDTGRVHQYQPDSSALQSNSSASSPLAAARLARFNRRAASPGAGAVPPTPAANNLRRKFEHQGVSEEVVEQQDLLKQPDDAQGHASSWVCSPVSASAAVPSSVAQLLAAAQGATGMRAMKAPAAVTPSRGAVGAPAAVTPSRGAVGAPADEPSYEASTPEKVHAPFTRNDASRARAQVQRAASKKAVSTSPASPTSPAPARRPRGAATSAAATGNKPPRNDSVQVFRRHYGLATGVRTGFSQAQQEAAAERARIAAWSQAQHIAALEAKAARVRQRAAQRAASARPALQGTDRGAGQQRSSAGVGYGEHPSAGVGSAFDAPQDFSGAMQRPTSIIDPLRLRSAVVPVDEQLAQASVDPAMHSPPPTAVVPTNASTSVYGSRFQLYASRRHLPVGSFATSDSGVMAQAAGALLAGGAAEVREGGSGLMAKGADGQLQWTPAAQKRRQELGLHSSGSAHDTPAAVRTTRPAVRGPAHAAAAGSSKPRTRQVAAQIAAASTAASRQAVTRGSTTSRRRVSATNMRAAPGAAGAALARSRAPAASAARTAAHPYDGAARYSRGPVAARSSSAPRSLRSISHRASTSPDGHSNSPVMRVLVQQGPAARGGRLSTRSQSAPRSQQHPAKSNAREGTGRANRRAELAYLKHVFRRHPQDAVDVAQELGLLPADSAAHLEQESALAAQGAVMSDAFDVRGASGQMLFHGQFDESHGPARQTGRGSSQHKLQAAAGTNHDRADTTVASYCAPHFAFGHSSRDSTPADVYAAPPLSPAAALTGLPYARQPRLARFQSDKHRIQKEALAMGVV